MTNGIFTYMNDLMKRILGTGAECEDERIVSEAVKKYPSMRVVGRGTLAVDSKDIEERYRSYATRAQQLVKAGPPSEQ